MVRKHIDTIEALMARYVAGALPEPARVLVAAHLEMKPANRLLVNGLDLLAGEMLEKSEPAPISERDRRLAEIFRSSPPEVIAEDKALPEDTIFPPSLRRFVGFRSEDIPWRRRLPGFREYPLGDIDGCEVNLMWIRAGRALPSHTHRGTELILILDGAFNDHRGRFAPGDISVADETLDHRPVAEKDRPCIAFSVMDAPIKLTGSLTRLIGDIIG
jgi:putative transcriptional regulator